MELTLVREHGDVLCGRCRIADTPLTRLRGLLGRSGLDPDEGMLLATSAIHTSFMRFPIDVVFLDRNFVTVRTVANLQPWRMAWHRRAHAVVELSAGTLERAAVEVGEQMSLIRQAPAATSEARAPRSSGDSPVRVAVASPDSRFLRVAQFLLARQEFEVETFRDARTLIKQDGTSDVVVLDSSASLATTARVMRELSVANPSTRFVVVGDTSNGDGAESHQALRVLPKWESFDAVVEEILTAAPGRSSAVG